MLQNKRILSHLVESNRNDARRNRLLGKLQFFFFSNCIIEKNFVLQVDKIKLTYSSDTRETSNPRGVDIKLPVWGNTDGIEWIDTSPLKYIDNGAYFEHITKALTNRGYIREKNLFGAPYDFRKGPSMIDIPIDFHN